MQALYAASSLFIFEMIVDNDANKRTALMAAVTFLSMNGVTIKALVSFAGYVTEAAQGLYAVGEVAAALSQLQ